MRKALERQFGLATIDIRQVVLDVGSRHEMVEVLAGLQHLYSRPSLREQALELVARDVLGERSAGQGAPGMDYWEVLVLGAVRQGCNLDYDALHDLANNHRALREMMGLDGWAGKEFKRSTINDNVLKLRPEMIDEISHLVVAEGHGLMPEAAQAVRGDGHVTETNIHYPTDANLMVDGLRVMLRLGKELGELTGVPGWRKHKDWLGKGKKLLRKIQKKAKGGDKNRQAQQDLYRNLIGLVREIADRSIDTIAQVKAQCDAGQAGWDLMASFQVDQLVEDLIDFQVKTRYVCQLAERRVLQGETIPNRDKVFSLFEPHTELINRGKCPNPIEFGRRVVIVEDRVGFIVECRVLDRGQQEAEVLAPMMKEVQARLNNKIRSASFDRGFYTPENRKELQKIVAVACLPKKGKLSGAALAQESAAEFRAARRRHSGVESAIHALQVGNGQDRCPDRGEEGYKRYVALGALGRNLQTLGRLVLKKKRRRRAG